MFKFANTDSGCSSLLLGYRYKLKDRCHSTEIKDEDKNKKDKAKAKKLFSKSKEKQGINGIRNRKNEPLLLNESQDEKMGLLQSKGLRSNSHNEQNNKSDGPKKADLCNGSTNIEQQKYSSLERRFLSDELNPNIDSSVKRQSIKVLHDSIGAQINAPKTEQGIKETIHVDETAVNKENGIFNKDKQSIKISLSLSYPNEQSKVETSIVSGKKTNVSKSPKFDRAGNSITKLIETINSNTELEAETKLSNKNKPKTDGILDTESRTKNSADVSCVSIEERPILSVQDIKPKLEEVVDVKPKILSSISTDKPKTENVTIIKVKTKKTEASESTITKKLQLNGIDSENSMSKILIKDERISNVPETVSILDSATPFDNKIEPEIDFKYVDETCTVNRVDLKVDVSNNREITSNIVSDEKCFGAKGNIDVSKSVLDDQAIKGISVSDKHNDFDVTAIANSISSEIWSNVLVDLKLFNKKIVIDRYSDNLADVIIKNNLQRETIDECDAGPPETVDSSFSNSYNEKTESQKILGKGDKDVRVVMSIDNIGNFTADIKGNEKSGDNTNELPAIILNDRHSKVLNADVNVSSSVDEGTKSNVVLRRKRGKKSSQNNLSSQVDEKRYSCTDRPVSGFAEQLAELLAKDDDLDFDIESDDELPDALEKIKETYQDNSGISSEIGKIQRKCSVTELKEYGIKNFKSKVKSKIDDKKTKLKGDRPLSLYEQDLLADLLDEEEFDDSNEVAEDTIESVQSSVQLLEDKIPFNREDRSFSTLSSASIDDYDSHDESTRNQPEDKPVCNGKAPRLGRAAVIDLGSGILKAGMCGEMEPSCYCPSVVGTPRRFSQDVSKMKKGYYVGDEAWTVAGMLSIDYPMNKTDVTNWPDVTRIIEHLLDSELKVNDRAHPIMLTEKGLVSSKHREKLTEIIFETFGVPAFYLANQASLALYSMGVTTGICLNAGFNCTQSVPVYEGHSIPHGTVQLDIGGDHVTKHLGRILSGSQGHAFNSSSEKLVLNSMKQSLCYVSQDLLNEEELYKRTANMLQTYTLPDGQEIELGTERFQAPEILFNPQSLGLNKPNSAEIIHQSIERMEFSLQSELKENVVVSGGTSKFSGYGPRLQKELSLISGSDESYKIKFTENPLLATWIGGSVLSSIGSFREQWITIDQYAEMGSKIVHKMCF